MDEPIVPVPSRSPVVRLVDERLHRLDDELDVIGGAAAPEARVVKRAVLVETVLTAVGYADDDRLDPLFGELLEHLVDTPLAREARRLVEEVLPVVHVERGVGAVRGGIRRREIDEDVARVAENVASHVAQHLDGSRDARSAAFIGVFVIQPVRHRPAR
jgi:hypothetical protein